MLRVEAVVSHNKMHCRSANCLTLRVPDLVLACIKRRHFQEEFAVFWQLLEVRDDAIVWPSG